VLHDFIDAVQAGAGATGDLNDAADSDEQRLAESLHGSDHEEELVETAEPRSTDGSGIRAAKLSFSPQQEPEDGRSSGTNDAGEHAEAPATSAGVRLSGAQDPEEVIDLPGSAESPEQLVSAVLGASNRWIGSPVKPPMLASASVAVSRDRRLVLLAAAQRGLAELRAIALAYRWLNENQRLVAMALPQFSIDPSAGVQLHLLVDHADIDAEVLQPLLQSGVVAVQSYRRLRWAGRSGLLLEAA